MYTLGIPDRQKRRTLGYLKQNYIEFEEHPSNEGFFDLSFPGMDEDAFNFDYTASNNCFDIDQNNICDLL